MPQGSGVAAGAAAAAASAEAVREKEKKINELIEELGNKELLLSEAQGQLAAVRAAAPGRAARRLSRLWHAHVSAVPGCQSEGAELSTPCLLALIEGAG